MFIVRHVLSQITSVSLPSARALRSSANSCKYPGISFAVNLNRSSTTRFHRKGESMPPGASSPYKENSKFFKKLKILLFTVKQHVYSYTKI